MPSIVGSEISDFPVPRGQGRITGAARRRTFDNRDKRGQRKSVKCDKRGADASTIQYKTVT